MSEPMEGPTLHDSTTYDASALAALAAEDATARSRARRRRLTDRIAAVRRRRSRRSTTTLAAVAALAACAAPLAVGASVKGRTADRPASGGVLESGARGAGVKALQRALGITADGMYGPATRRAVRRFQRRNGLEVDGVAGPITLGALGIGAGGGATRRTAAPEQPAGDASGVLARIAQCESGGDPTAVSPDGRYRGKYQFSRETWTSLGGEGDPADAPEAEQDRLAALLYSQRGSAPWPVCGSQA